MTPALAFYADAVWARHAIFRKIYLYNLYLPSAVFIAQVLVGPSKQLKQIIQMNIILLHNILLSHGIVEERLRDEHEERRLTSVVHTYPVKTVTENTPFSKMLCRVETFEIFWLSRNASPP